MNKYAFLEKLGNLYPADSEDSKSFQERVTIYTKLLDKKEKLAEKELDYERMLELIIGHYPYRFFPNYTEIAKYYRFKEESQEIKSNKKQSNSLTAAHIKEPRKFRLKANNTLYIFEEVPSSWTDVHSISDFDEIEEI